MFAAEMYNVGISSLDDHVCNSLILRQFLNLHRDHASAKTRRYHASNTEGGAF
jgi:hypothetical protein